MTAVVRVAQPEPLDRTPDSVGIHSQLLTERSDRPPLSKPALKPESDAAAERSGSA
jgi:hypothetical protein